MTRELWGIFNKTTGKRASRAAYLSRENAERHIAARHADILRGERPDLQRLFLHDGVEARLLTDTVHDELCRYAPAYDRHECDCDLIVTVAAREKARALEFCCEDTEKEFREKIVAQMDALRPTQECISSRRGESPVSCGCWVCVENRVINRFVEIVWKTPL